MHPGDSSPEPGGATPQARFPRGLGWLLVLGLLARLAYAGLIPAWEQPDERAHFGYVEYLYAEGRVPIRTEADRYEEDGGWHLVRSEYFQPPLYYAVLLPVYGACQGAGLDDGLTVLALRFATLLMTLPVPVLVWGALRRALPESPDLALAAASVPALLPSFVNLSASVNPSALAAVLGTLVLDLCTRMVTREPSRRGLCALAAALALAQYTQNSLLLLGAAPVTTAWLAPPGAARRGLLAATFAGLLLALPIFAFNQVHYGYFIGDLSSYVPVSAPWTERVGRGMQFLVRTLWGTFGRLRELNAPWSAAPVTLGKMNRACEGVSLAALAGLLRSARQLPLRPLAPSAVTLLVFLAACVKYCDFEPPTARYVFPVLLPGSAGLALGLRPWLGRFTAPGLAGFLVAMNLYILGRLLVPYYGFP